MRVLKLITCRLDRSNCVSDGSLANDRIIVSGFSITPVGRQLGRRGIDIARRPASPLRARSVRQSSPEGQTRLHDYAWRDPAPARALLGAPSGA